MASYNQTIKMTFTVCDDGDGSKVMDDIIRQLQLTSGVCDIKATFKKELVPSQGSSKASSDAFPIVKADVDAWDEADWGMAGWEPVNELVYVDDFTELKEEEEADGSAVGSAVGSGVGSAVGTTRTVEEKDTTVPAQMPPASGADTPHPASKLTLEKYKRAYLLKGELPFHNQELFFEIYNDEYWAEKDNIITRNGITFAYWNKTLNGWIVRPRNKDFMEEFIEYIHLANV